MISSLPVIWLQNVASHLEMFIHIAMVFSQSVHYLLSLTHFLVPHGSFVFFAFGFRRKEYENFSPLIRRVPNPCLIRISMNLTLLTISCLNLLLSNDIILVPRKGSYENNHISVSMFVGKGTFGNHKMILYVK
jgi:hypothetical protein